MIETEGGSVSLQVKYALMIAAFRDLGEKLKAAHARITELEDALREIAEMGEDELLTRAEQAEAHAADCKRLVAACENDIDELKFMLRLAWDDEYNYGDNPRPTFDEWLADLRARAGERHE